MLKKQEKSWQQKCIILNILFNFQQNKSTNFFMFRNLVKLQEYEKANSIHEEIEKMKKR